MKIVARGLRPYTECFCNNVLAPTIEILKPILTSQGTQYVPAYFNQVYH